MHSLFKPPTTGEPGGHMGSDNMDFQAHLPGGRGWTHSTGSSAGPGSEGEEPTRG